MDTPRWVTDSVFYQIFPDRFAMSDRAPKRNLHLEAWDSPPTTRGFKGGDLYGVLEHLDYLDDLGINAIYLTPIFASASNHRYHTYDYFSVDPILGGEAAFRALLDAAHKRSMRVVLDGVFNHASRGLWQFHHTLENGSASPYVDWFHFDPERLAGDRHWGAYPSVEEQQAIPQEGSLRAIGYTGWWDLPALPKFNTAVPAVREFLFSVADHWMRYGIDGWRLDVPGEIDDDSFWREFRSRVRSVNPDAYLVGELWGDASRWLQGDQFDGSMNYPVTAACLGFFTGRHLDLEQALKPGGLRGQVMPMDGREFGERIVRCLGRYSAEANRAMLNPLDTHDTPRFLTCAGGDAASLKLALTFILAYPGAPCLFYGDEIGLTGGHDPGCRRSFPWSEESWNRELRSFTRNLIHIRRARPSLRWGRYTGLWANKDIYAFERVLGDERTLVVLNAGEQVQDVKLEAPQPTDSSLRLLAGACEIIGLLPTRLRVPAREAAVLGSGDN